MRYHFFQIQLYKLHRHPGRISTVVNNRIWGYPIGFVPSRQSYWSPSTPSPSSTTNITSTRSCYNHMFNRLHFWTEWVNFSFLEIYRPIFIFLRDFSKRFDGSSIDVWWCGNSTDRRPGVVGDQSQRWGPVPVWQRYSPGHRRRPPHGLPIQLYKLHRHPSRISTVVNNRIMRVFGRFCTVTTVVLIALNTLNNVGSRAMQDNLSFLQRYHQLLILFTWF